MKKIALFLTLIVFFSCKKNSDEPQISNETEGSIFATVVYNGAVIEGAVITTEPVTEEVKTDITGTAIISKVPIGGYKANATHPEIGTGSAPVTVTANEVMDVRVNLIGGNFESPLVNIESPQNNAVFNVGDIVEFVATVSDSKDNSNELKVEWSSSIEGVLSNEGINSGNTAKFNTSKLSEGEHTIIFKATDTDNLVGTDEIKISIKELPNAVELNSVNLTKEGLNLSWTKSDEAEFESYHITRSTSPDRNFEVIDIISDINTTTYSDLALTFGVLYYYQIKVVLKNGDEAFSNIESNLFEGENIDLGVNIVNMLVDETRPYIYALDQINNSLLFINKDTKTVEKTIFVGSSPTDLDVNIDNTTMYIANFGSTQIAVVDLQTREKTDDIFVDPDAGTWDGNPYSLVYLKGNYLAYTSEDQWNNIKVVDAATGTLVSYAGSIHSPFLTTNPAHDVVYARDGGQIIRFNLDEEGTLTQVDESNLMVTSNKMEQSPYRKIVISGDGKYIFNRTHKLLSNNLSSNLGTLGERIFVSNFDGSTVVGEEHIWNATNFSIDKSLPVQSMLMELDSDNSTLYLYDNNSSKIYLTTID